MRVILKGMARSPVEPIHVGLGALFDVVPEAVIVAEATSGEVLLWNRGASELFGYSASEAFGMSIRELVPEDLKEQHDLGLSRFAETGSGRLIQRQGAIEVPALHRDGQSMWIELRLSALPPSEVAEPLVLAVIRDVTERRTAYSELQAANRDLRELLSITAQDLKASVTAISSTAEMLRYVRDPELLLDIIERQAVRLNELIEEWENRPDASSDTRSSS